MKHVIIGAGPAGVVASETLRKLDPNSDITLFGDEQEPPYSRMAIPYLLIDKIGEQGTYLRKTDGFFDSKRIDVVRDKVTGVSASDKTLTMANGGNTSFDKLLIAAGSSAVSPPIPGVDSEGVYNCWTMEDARHIIKLAEPGSKVVLMGAGFIGCIILEALASRKVDLTVIEMENRMVPRMMDQASGELIKRWCENKGVKVLTSTKVAAIHANTGTLGKLFGGGKKSALGVELDNGETIPADLVISATGVRPNTEFIDGSGIETDHGILVNHHLETSHNGIFAAGDIAQGKDFSTGEYSVQAIQPTAADHGRIAATNMVEGQEVVHQGSVNMNVLDTMGLVSTSFGLWEGAKGGQSTSLRDPGRYRYLNLQFEDDLLVGANSLGMTQHVGVLRGLIQSKLHLGKWKDRLLDNPLLISEAYLATAQG